MPTEHAPERDAPAVRRLIRKSQLLDLVPLSFPTIWEMMRRGEFPLPVKLGSAPNAPSAWFEDEVAAKVESLERVEYKPAASTAEADAA